MSVMGKLNFFLGFQIYQMKKGTFTNQSKYTNELLKIFGIEDSKEARMPICTSKKLDKDEEDINVDEKSYRGMIHSLLYLIASSLDTTFAVCLCIRFQYSLRNSHLIVVKKNIEIFERNRRLWFMVF